MEIYNYCKHLVEENISQEFRFKKIDETRNYLIKQINRKKHKFSCSTITGCVFFFCFYFFSWYSNRNY